MIRAVRHALLAMMLSAIPLGFAVPMATRPGEQRHASAKDRKAEDIVEVILALQRHRGLHVLDAGTLETTGCFVEGNLDRSVSASPDGRTLFIEQASDSLSCCSLFALDLETQKMCRLVEPSSRGVPTPDGRMLLTQRGNVGIEVFNGRTLVRMPTIAAPGGPYTFYPSPDSRWLFGISYFRGLSLDMFDLERGELIRRLPFTEGKFPRGVWLEDQFYCIAHDGNQLLLWKLTEQTRELGLPVTVALPDLASSGVPFGLDVIAVGHHLAVHEFFGMKLDRRRDKSDAGTLPGGVFIIEPTSTRVIAHLAPSVHFASLVASADGQFLYGIDSGALDWQGPVRLLKINIGSGAVAAERLLETSVWSIAVTKIPGRLVPRGEVRVRSCEVGSQQSQNR